MRRWKNMQQEMKGQEDEMTCKNTGRNKSWMVSQSHTKNAWTGLTNSKKHVFLSLFFYKQKHERHKFAQNFGCKITKSWIQKGDLGSGEEPVEGFERHEMWQVEASGGWNMTLKCHHFPFRPCHLVWEVKTEKNNVCFFCWFHFGKCVI